LRAEQQPESNALYFCLFNGRGRHVSIGGDESPASDFGTGYHFRIVLYQYRYYARRDQDSSGFPVDAF